MAAGICNTLFANPEQQRDFFDDFNQLDSTTVWDIDTGDDNAALTTGGDSVSLTTSATDNNESLIHTLAASWDVTQYQPLMFRSRILLDDTATSSTNLFVGLSSAFAANKITDDGAGLAASWSGFGFYKLDTDTTWRVASSVGTSATTTATTASTPDSATLWQGIEIRVTPYSSTNAWVHFLLNEDANGGSAWTPVTDSNNNIIVHDLVYTSFAAAEAGVYTKCGTAAAVTTKVDYIRVSQIKS